MWHKELSNESLVSVIEALSAVNELPRLRFVTQLAFYFRFGQRVIQSLLSYIPVFGNFHLFSGLLPSIHFRFVSGPVLNLSFVLKSRINPHRIIVNPRKLKYRIKLRERVNLFWIFGRSAAAVSERRRRKSWDNNCVRSWGLRSPFLQTVYFEYCIRLGLVDEKWREKRKIPPHSHGLCEESSDQIWCFPWFLHRSCFDVAAGNPNETEFCFSRDWRVW